MRQLTSLGIGLIGVIIGAIFVGGRGDIAANNALLPFQGHLTDATGAAIPDGARVVQFKIYDAPVSGTAVWAGEVHKLSVNAGLVNTLLGSKTDLSGVNFSQPTYLDITIDADGEGTITAADPPLLPRQAIVPSIYAVASGSSSLVEGVDILDENKKLVPNLFGTDSIGPDAIADDAVTSEVIVDGTISRTNLSTELRNGIIPSGTVVPFAGTAAKVPAGWLLCDGRALQSSAHTNLHAAIGTAWGDASNDGDPSTDFRIPDLQGVFLRGVNSSSSVAIQSIDPGNETATINGHGISASGYPVGVRLDLGPRGIITYRFFAIYVDSNTLAFADSYDNSQFGTKVPISLLFGDNAFELVRAMDPAPERERVALYPGGASGVAVGSFQFDELKEHRHDLSPSRVSIDSSGAGIDVPRVVTSVNQPLYTGYVGGTETRPRNASVNYIIKL